MENILNVSNRQEFRSWLMEHAAHELECWVNVKRGKPADPEVFYYLDAVEEALCFGWIDSTCKKLPDGRLVQRLSPRRKRSHWTELNRQRCLDLEHRGLMTDAGRAALPLSPTR